jgi:hypothetical protein
VVPTQSIATPRTPARSAPRPDTATRPADDFDDVAALAEVLDAEAEAEAETEADPETTAAAAAVELREV